MPKIIDHLKRKREIFHRAIEQFTSSGYRQTSLADIAAASELSRPTLYKYFHDKDQLLFFAIKDFTDGYLNHFQQMAADQRRSAPELIGEISHSIINSCFSQRREIMALTDVLLNRDDKDNSKLVRHRTEKLRGLYYQLVERGIRNNEIRSINIDDCINTLFAIEVWSIVELALNPNQTQQRSLRAIDSYIQLLATVN